MSEFSLDDVRQDVNDPIWPSEPIEAGVQHVGHGHELRTLAGPLDLLQHVVEEVREWEHGQGHMPHRKPDKPLILPMFSRASKSLRLVTFDIGTGKGPNGTLVVEPRDDRLRVIVTNWGPGNAYVSHDSTNGNNTAIIPPPGPDASKTGQSNSRTFYSCAAIWAFPAVAGTAQLIDIQDEYGLPE